MPSDVEIIQTQLRDMGNFYAGPINGVADQALVDAIKRFQANMQIPETGLWDQGTLRAVDMRYGNIPGWNPNPYIDSPTTPPPPAPPVTPPPVNPGVPAADQSARSIIDATLAMYGLSSLSTWAWERFLAGAPIETIIFEMRQRPEYALRFPAMTALQQAGHAISESEYIGYEVAVTGLMRQYGIPAGFYDQPDDFTAFLSGQVSIAEVSQRLAAYTDIANAQDPQVLAELQNLYGITAGQLTAYFIDPDRATPLLQRQAQAAITSAQAYGTGFGSLTQAEAERYGGVNPAGFATLAGLSEVMGELPGEGQGAVSRGTGLAAVYDQNVAAQQAIQARQARRVAEFEAGGSYSGGTAGIGAGSRT